MMCRHCAVEAEPDSDTCVLHEEPPSLLEPGETWRVPATVQDEDAARGEGAYLDYLYGRSA